jgi:hypothetical protein
VPARRPSWAELTARIQQAGASLPALVETDRHPRAGRFTLRERLRPGANGQLVADVVGNPSRQNSVVARARTDVPRTHDLTYPYCSVGTPNRRYACPCESSARPALTLRDERELITAAHDRRAIGVPLATVTSGQSRLLPATPDCRSAPVTWRVRSAFQAGHEGSIPLRPLQLLQPSSRT